MTTPMASATKQLETKSPDRHAYLNSQRGNRTLTIDESQELHALDRACLPQRLAKALSTYCVTPKQHDAHVDLYRARKAADRAIMGLVGGIV